MSATVQQPFEPGNDGWWTGQQPVAVDPEAVPGSDTITSDMGVTIQDDQLSPLIYRHVEASTRELRSQVQEMGARSRRMEARLNELLARSSMNSVPRIADD